VSALARLKHRNWTALLLLERITWYDVLGLTAGASPDTILLAYEERTRQLTPTQFAGAPYPVVMAATRAREAAVAAWQVLSDPDRRHRYDAGIGLHRRRSGGSFADGPGSLGLDPLSTVRKDPLPAADPLPAVDALTRWMAAQPAPPRRRLAVPDVRGLFYQPCQALVTMAGLRIAVVRLTPDPLPVEGLIVDQSPGGGSHARLRSTLTVLVWHPPRRP